MSQLVPALAYLLMWEDPNQTFESSPDACPVGCEGPCYAVAGINSGVFPADYEAVMSLPNPQRKAAVGRFYQAKFWAPMQIGGIEDQDVANRVLDCGVNQGPVMAGKLLQRAINNLGGKLVEDSHLGPISLAAANQCASDSLLAAFRTARSQLYRDIVTIKPEDEKYLAEWLRRAQA